MDTKPFLVERGVKSFVNSTLRQCREFKNKYNNGLLNIGLFVGLCLLTGLILLFKYKGKLTPQEKKEKDQEKKQYILTKIRNFQDAKQKAQQELITGLPHWDTD